MKILLISGHGNGDPGACGCGLKEAEETRRVTKLIKKYLDMDCDIYDINRNAFDDCNAGKLNVKGYSYVLEIHFNAFNGRANGTEIYFPSTAQITGYEDSIMKKLGKYFTIRNGGVKEGRFGVINTCSRQGVKANLLEVAFIDNATDMNIYKANVENIAKDIANVLDDLIGDENMTGEQIETKSKEFRCSKEESDWSKKEGAWKKATDKKIVNGKNPQDYITRQEFTAVLDRLGLIK